MYEYKCTVRRVVDGDTVDVDIDLGFSVRLDNQRIRLCGLDTPESRTRDEEEKKYGKLATAFVCCHLKEGQSYTLQTSKDGVGKFGRILGTFILTDGRNLNEMLVEKHLAVAYHGQSKEDIEAEHLANREKVDLAETFE